MASLDSAKKKIWKEALTNTSAPWVVCGINVSELGNAAALEGMIGLVDWSVHGQVSRLLLRGDLKAGETCVIPGRGEGLRPSFLIYSLGKTNAAQALFEKAKQIGISDLALAESTFPEDFLSKLKQTLKKEGIRFTTLEPES